MRSILLAPTFRNFFFAYDYLKDNGMLTPVDQRTYYLFPAGSRYDQLALIQRANTHRLSVLHKAVVFQ